MDDVNVFLAHAIQLEFDAVRRYEDLRASMQTIGNKEAQAFFGKMAEFSRLHLKDALRRGGFHEIPKLADDQWQWPEGVSPEQAAWAGVDGFVDAATAYRLALDGEERSQLFYAAIVANTTDYEVRRMAKAFAEEESEHVAELERIIARLAA
jgi:rubrerythrin